MKTRQLTILSVLLSLLLSIGCASTDAVAKAKTQKIPLSGEKYRSSEYYWRVVQVGTSPDLSMAKKVAMQNARAELSATIQTEVKAIMETYSENTVVADDAEVMSIYKERAYSVVEQTLVGAELQGEELKQDKKGLYSYHVCLQLNKVTMADELAKAFMRDNVLKGSFDKDLFKKIYDDYMKAQQGK